jgi:hypothetical protein
MPEVATVRTPATPAQAIGAIIAALPAGAPRVASSIIGGQSALETATWRSMNGWNMGNITPTAAQAASGPWMTQWLKGMRFIVYPSLLDGARGMVRWLTSHGLLPFAYAGDVDGYVSRLAATCYMGCIGKTDPTGHTVTQADYDALAATIRGRVPAFNALVPEAPPSGLVPGVPDWLLVGGAAATALLGFRLGWWGGR